MIGIPRTIRVGGINYTVTLHDELHQGGQELCGSYTSHECSIKLDTGISPQYMDVTIWHEVVHAILTHAGQEEHDEALVSLLAYGVVQVLRDNPMLRLNEDEPEGELAEFPGP